MGKMVLLILSIFITNVALATELTDEETALFTTRTSPPQLSAQLTAALELDVAPWHKKGVPQVIVNSGKEVARKSAEIALQALQTLDPAVMQNDVDRAWVASETADALKDSGRESEAIAAYKNLLEMSLTAGQRHDALASLHKLGVGEGPELCPVAKLMAADRHDDVVYPPTAASRGIEGWATAIVDVQADGSVSSASIHSSSMRVFEQPYLTWLLSHHWESASSGGIAKPCYMFVRKNFRLSKNFKPTFTFDEIEPNTVFTYRSIGAAIRYRGEVRQQLLDNRK